MTPDELKSIPKGNFVVMKTGTHPMKTRLRLYLDWGITFEEPYTIPEKSARTVAYAGKQELERAIMSQRKPDSKQADSTEAEQTIAQQELNQEKKQVQEDNQTHDGSSFRA
jgi:type IV secretion system protein VirD4